MKVENLYIHMSLCHAHCSLCLIFPLLTLTLTMASLSRVRLETVYSFLYTLPLLFLAYLIYLYLFGPLSHISGPHISRISNLWKLNSAWHEDIPKRLITLHQQYGPIVRIGSNSISVNDPAAYQIIYGFRLAFKKVSL